MNRINKPTVMFRCDGGNIPEIGTGRIRRCLNLAICLRGVYKINSRFIIRDLDGEPPRVLHHRFAVHLLPPVSDWEISALRIIKRVAPQLVVVDALDKGGRFLRNLKTELPQIPTITLDDTGEGLEYATCSINGMLESSKANYNGPDYAIILSGDETPAGVRPDVGEVFLSFGGYDHNNLTLKALEALTKLKRPLNVTALVGASFHDERKLLDLADKSEIGRLDIIRESPNIGSLLKKSDIGIVSGGITLFEAMHCGIPSLVISQYELQTATAARFHLKNAVIDLGLGESIDTGKISESVESLINDYSRRKALSQRAAELVDGRGLWRIAEIVNVIARPEAVAAKRKLTPVKV